MLPIGRYRTGPRLDTEYNGTALSQSPGKRSLGARANAKAGLPQHNVIGFGIRHERVHRLGGDVHDTGVSGALPREPRNSGVRFGWAAITAAEPNEGFRVAGFGLVPSRWKPVLGVCVLVRRVYLGERLYRLVRVCEGIGEQNTATMAVPSGGAGGRPA